MLLMATRMRALSARIRRATARAATNTASTVASPAQDADAANSSLAPDHAASHAPSGTT